MEPWDFLQQKTLKINITMGYTSVFTTSVFKASNKFERLGKTHLSILSRETSL